MVSLILDIHSVAFALTEQKPDTIAYAKQIATWTHANKLSRHTIIDMLSNKLFNVYVTYKEACEILVSITLKYTVEDVSRQ